MVPEGQNNYDVMAQKYLEWADRLGENNLALWCVSQAYSIYENSRMLDKAVPICTRLRTQKTNPAIAWRYQFTDIELLLLQGKQAEAATAAITRLAGESRPQFRVYRQLNMGSLGAAFGKTNRVADAKTLCDKLVKLYKFADDQNTAENMLVAAYVATEDPIQLAKAAEILLRNAREMEPSDLGYGQFMSAAYYARLVQKYDDVISQAMRQMPKAQHLMPRMLKDLGLYYLGVQNPKVFTIQSQLASGYPASASRDELDARIEAARAAANKKGGN